VSRIVARDALRTLEAQGIVDIKVGSGGGARISRAMPPVRRGPGGAARPDRRVVGEIMDAQRAIECLAAELAALNSTAEDHVRLRELIAYAERKIDDVAAYTRARGIPSRGAEASHNRVLVVQLISLQHVSWGAGAEPDPDAESRTPHSRRPTKELLRSSRCATPPARDG